MNTDCYRRNETLCIYTTIMNVCYIQDNFTFFTPNNYIFFAVFVCFSRDLRFFKIKHFINEIIILFPNNFEFFIILPQDIRRCLKDTSVVKSRGPHFLSDVKNNVGRKKERSFRAIFREISRICFDSSVSGVFYCIWLVGDSCFNSRAHMCCGQPVRPLLFVGSSWPRFKADCIHDSFCRNKQKYPMTYVSIKS